LRQVDADAARKRSDVTLERRARPKGDDGGSLVGAELYDRCNFLGAVSKSDRVGGVRRVIGLVFAVVVANSCRGGEAIAEELAKLGE